MVRGPTHPANPSAIMTAQSRHAAATARADGGQPQPNGRCSTRRRYAPRATDTGEQRSRLRGQPQHEATSPRNGLVERRCPETGTAGAGGGPGKPTGGNTGRAPRVDLMPRRRVGRSSGGQLGAEGLWAVTGAGGMLPRMGTERGVERTETIAATAPGRASTVTSLRPRRRPLLVQLLPFTAVSRGDSTPRLLPVWFTILRSLLS